MYRVKKWFLIVLSIILVLPILISGCESGKQISTDMSSSQSLATSSTTTTTTPAAQTAQQ